MDVIWLKKDVRLHDHGPLTKAVASSNKVLILYLYEPDQLSHPTIHGSHINFQNEGLEDFIIHLRAYIGTSPSSLACPITFIKSEATAAFALIHQRYPITRILAHMETGHLVSFDRDIRVRKWCKENRIQFREFQQTGVTRGLKDRNQFTKRYNEFVNRVQWRLPDKVTDIVKDFHNRLITLPAGKYTQNDTSIHVYDRVLSLADLKDYLVAEHAYDRPSRQRGGETLAFQTFNTFLNSRGEGYARGVSSPNTSWDSCSRLSPYLSAGHISIRYVSQTLKLKQQTLRNNKKNSKEKFSKDDWLRSLAAFHSRIRWRSHFIQKLESEPQLEKHAACKSLDKVRTTDWNEQRFESWKTGKTGYPLVDACIRCLEQHGWINFRMRAMLTSFACYNLWLDWRGISHYLARSFLDFEAGIHYPQLQMQAGVTGINTMRVYSVIKQSYDQDAKGIFIKKYVSELRGVPHEYVHEPWKMKTKRGKEIVMKYFERVVNEKESGKLAKSRLQSIRTKKETKQEAQKVFEKHGSRRGGRTLPETAQNGPKPKRARTEILGEDVSKRKQVKISELFNKTTSKESNTENNSERLMNTTKDENNDASWACQACTFENANMKANSCEMCETERNSK